MLFIYIFAMSLISSIVFSENNFSEITIEIDGRNYQIYYTISRRENMNEGYSYVIKDELMLETTFFVEGYRKYGGTPGSTRWNILVHNPPNEAIEESILSDIYFNKNNLEARESFKDIFRQIYEKIGFPE